MNFFLNHNQLLIFLHFTIHLGPWKGKTNSSIPLIHWQLNTVFEVFFNIFLTFNQLLSDSEELKKFLIAVNFLSYIHLIVEEIFHLFLVPNSVILINFFDKLIFIFQKKTANSVIKHQMLNFFLIIVEIFLKILFRNIKSYVFFLNCE